MSNSSLSAIVAMGITIICWIVGVWLIAETPGPAELLASLFLFLPVVAIQFALTWLLISRLGLFPEKPGQGTMVKSASRPVHSSPVSDPDVLSFRLDKSYMVLKLFFLLLLLGNGFFQDGRFSLLLAILLMSDLIYSTFRVDFLLADNILVFYRLFGRKSVPVDTIVSARKGHFSDTLVMENGSSIELSHLITHVGRLTDRIAATLLPDDAGQVHNEQDSEKEK